MNWEVLVNIFSVMVMVGFLWAYVMFLAAVGTNKIEVMMLALVGIPFIVLGFIGIFGICLGISKEFC